jgi:hypothetical protein
LVRVIAAVLAAILAIAGAAVVVIVGFRIDPPNCTLFGADKGEWEQANREVLSDVPIFPGSTLMYETMNGCAVADDRCIAFESGPYDSYATFVRYRVPARGTFAQVSDFYDRELSARGWSVPPPEFVGDRQYTRANAKHWVRGDDDFWEFIVTYKDAW